MSFNNPLPSGSSLPGSPLTPALLRHVREVAMPHLRLRFPGGFESTTSAAPSLTYFSEFLIKQSDRVSSLRNLRRGWDGYKARPPSERATRNALLLLSLLDRAGIHVTQASPSVEGGVGLFVRSGRGYVHFEATNRGPILVGLDDGAETPVALVTRASTKALSEVLEQVRAFLSR